MMKKDEKKKKKKINSNNNRKKKENSCILNNKHRKKRKKHKKQNKLKRIHFLFAERDGEEVMDDDSVIFTEPSSRDYLPKGTRSRLPLTEIMEGFNLTIILLPLLILFSSMDFKHKIIQWNCRGLKPNYNEVSLLISEYNPSVFCFQETFLKPDDNISLKGLMYITMVILIV